MKILLKISLSLFPILCWAYKPSFDSLTVEELWAEADFVAVITVTQGKYLESSGFEIKGLVDLPLKGEKTEMIELVANFPLFDAPNELGQRYLVYTSKNSEEKFKLISHKASVIRVFRSEIQDKEDLESSLLNLGTRTASIFERGGYLWSVICPVEIQAEECKLYQSSAKNAFNKALKTDAR